MIKNIAAAQRLDSRGNPTVQVDVTTAKGFYAMRHNQDPE